MIVYVPFVIPSMLYTYMYIHVCSIDGMYILVLVCLVVCTTVLTHLPVLCWPGAGDRDRGRRRRDSGGRGGHTPTTTHHCGVVGSNWSLDRFIMDTNTQHSTHTHVY